MKNTYIIKGLVLFSMFTLVMVCGCDQTWSVRIWTPEDGEHFTAETQPYTITVHLVCDASMLFYKNYSSGTIYVNGIQAAKWSEAAPYWEEPEADVDVDIYFGENFIEAISDNRKGYDTATVYLDQSSP